MYSYSYITGYHAHNSFKKFPNKIKGNEDKTKLDKEFINSDKLLSFYERSKIETVKFVASTNTPLLAKMRINVESLPLSDVKIGPTKFDTLTVTNLFELLFSVRYVIFSPSSGNFLLKSYLHVFHKLTEKDGKSMMNPIALTMLIVTDGYADKK